MAMPLVVLAILSIAGGFIGLPEVFHMPHILHEFLKPVLLPTEKLATVHPELHHAISHSDEWLVMGVSVVVSLIGIGVASSMYLSKKQVPDFEPATNPLIKLTNGKFFFDEIYNAIIVKPLTLIANIFSVMVDLLMINLFVEGLGIFTRFAGSSLKSTQAGRVSGYAFLMVCSILLFALVFIFKIV